MALVWASSLVKFPLIWVRPSRIQARATGASKSWSSMMIAIRLVAWDSAVDMRRVRSEKISEPRPLNCRLITQPIPTEFVEASARVRSSPERPRSVSVNVVQAAESQVRSLNSSMAV